MYLRHPVHVRLCIHSVQKLSTLTQRVHDKAGTFVAFDAHSESGKAYIANYIIPSLTRPYTCTRMRAVDGCGYYYSDILEHDIFVDTTRMYSYQLKKCVTILQCGLVIDIDALRKNLRIERHKFSLLPRIPQVEFAPTEARLNGEILRTVFGDLNTVIILSMISQHVFSFGSNKDHLISYVGGLPVQIINGVTSSGKSTAMEIIQQLYNSSGRCCISMNDTTISGLLNTQNQFPGITLLLEDLDHTKMNNANTQTDQFMFNCFTVKANMTVKHGLRVGGQSTVIANTNDVDKICKFNMKSENSRFELFEWEGYVNSLTSQQLQQNALHIEQLKLNIQQFFPHILCQVPFHSIYTESLLKVKEMHHQFVEHEKLCEVIPTRTIAYRSSLYATIQHLLSSAITFNSKDFIEKSLLHLWAKSYAVTFIFNKTWSNTILGIHDRKQQIDLLHVLLHQHQDINHCHQLE